MSITRMTGALALAITFAACSDAPSTAPASSKMTPTAPAMARPATPAPSTAVTGTVTNALGTGTFTGTATLTRVATSGTNLVGDLLITGTALVNGVATPVSQLVTGVTLAAAGTCPILSLAIGAIHLDLLGLVIDLAPVNLDIVAQSGPGQLLGNLLCAVVNLLNGPTGGAVGNALANLLNTINGLLGGLL
jgi:hypothetical protein